jgi:hypothetical protein
MLRSASKQGLLGKAPTPNNNNNNNNNNNLRAN